jgi:tetratricopeptide (TPR) repeat protein
MRPTAVVAILCCVTLAAMWMLSRKSLDSARLEALRTRPLLPAVKPELTTESFTVPGPDGRRVTARFYGLERLPPSDGDVCPLLRERLSQIPVVPKPSSTDSDDAETETRRNYISQQVDAICGGKPLDGEEPIAESARGWNATMAAMTMSLLDHKPAADERFAAALAHWILVHLRKALKVEEVTDILLARSGLSDADDNRRGLIFRRFSADLVRLGAELCSARSDPDCRARELVSVGRSYSRLGRLGTDEQSFRDMAEALDEAEPLVRKMQDKKVRIDLLDDIASAFGYAGEAGRDHKLLLRAVEIAEKSVAELESTKDGDGKWDYGEALGSLQSNLGRLAGSEIDRIAVTKRAVDVGEQAIAHRHLSFPETPSWGEYINLAASQRDLFELTRDRAWIDPAIANARRALEIHKERGDIKPDDMQLYIKVRLGQALVWKARHDGDIPEEDRLKHFDEARLLFDEAEPFFRTMNTQAYLRIITRTRHFLPEADQKK